MKIKNSFVVSLRLFLLFALIVGLPSAGLAQRPAKTEIKVGFSMSLTGIYAAGAKSQMNAYQLWAEEVNKKGGIFVKEYNKRLLVKLVSYDDRSSPDVTVKVYEKLITDDKVDLVLTPWGATTHFAIIPLAEKYRFPMVGSTASSVKIRELNPKYFWFVTPSLADRTSLALVKLLKSAKIKKVAVIYLQELRPREDIQFLKPYLTEAGFDVLLVKDYPPGVKDLTPLLTEVKRKNPEAVIALSYPADAFLITAQAKEVGLNPKFIFELVGPAIAFFQEKFGPAVEGIATMGDWNPRIKWAGAKEFNDKYIKRWGVKPDYLDSVEAWTECQILEQAVEKAGALDREKIREAIATQEFKTIRGPIRFTGPENKVTAAGVLQWQKGELEVVWPPEVATAKLLFPKPVWP